MTGTHGIDIEPFHDRDVADHVKLGDGVALLRIHLMPVGTLDQDRLSVDQQLAALDLHIAETELEVRMVGDRLLGRGRNGKGVKVGRFCRPEFRIRDRDPGRRHILGRDGTERDIFFARCRDGEIQMLDAGSHNRGHLEFARSGRYDPQVADPVLGPRIDVGVTRQTRQTPEVLVLQIGPVAPAEDLQRDQVFTRNDIFRDIETGFQLAVFAVSDLFPVDPDTDVGRSGADAEEDVLPDPGRIHYESPAVLSCIVVLKRRIGRIVLIMALPGITHVEINRITVPVKFPKAGDRHIIPAGVIPAGRKEIAGTGFDGLVPFEFPSSVQGEPLSVGVEMSRHFNAVTLIDGRILPVFNRRFLGSMERNCGRQGGRKDQKQFAHKLSFQQQRCKPGLRQTDRTSGPAGRIRPSWRPGTPSR